MLYKRAFRKEKEVTTFLIKDKMIELALDLSVEPYPYQKEATQWALAEGQGGKLPCRSHRRPWQRCYG